MGRGLGEVQRGVLEFVRTHPEGSPADEIVRQLHGAKATPAQHEAVRRAIRTLRSRDLVSVEMRWQSRPRKSLKRLVDIAPCEAAYCDACAQRKRRVRVGDWHRRAMRANAKYDAAWLDDLALAEASGFVHVTASEQRVVDIKPRAVDDCLRRVQFVVPPPASESDAMPTGAEYRTAP